MDTITVQNLDKVKSELSKIKPIIEGLLTIWPSNKLTMVSVLVQNLCFKGYGYSVEDDYKKCEEIVKFLNLLAQYDTNDHAVGFISEEVSICWDGFWISLHI